MVIGTKVHWGFIVVERSILDVHEVIGVTFFCHWGTKVVIGLFLDFWLTRLQVLFFLSNSL